MSDEFVKKLDDYKEEYRKIARRHDLDPEKLRDILELSTRGYNRSEIARRTDVSRQTVHRYLKKVKKEVDDDEFREMIIGLLATIGGLYLLKKFLE